MPASSQLTLRDVPRRLRAAIDREARRRGLSLNRTLIALLAEATGLTAEDRRGAVEHDDLDHLAGTWTKNEAHAFERSLAEQRQVDAKLWR